MENSNNSLMKRIVFGILAALVPLSALVSLPKSADVPYTSEVYYLVDDIEENGEPFTGRNLSRGEELVLTWEVLEDKSIAYPTLNLNTEYCAIEVYIDDELFFQYGDKETVTKKVFGRTPISIPLPEDCYGKTLSLHLYASQNVTFTTDAIYYGNIEDIGNFYFKNRRFALWVGMFLCVFGLLLTATVPFLKSIYSRSKNILFHGPLLLCLGIYFLSYNQLFFIILPKPLVSNYVEYLSLYILPFLVQGATLAERNSKINKVGKLFLLVDGVFIISSLILSFTGVIFIRNLLKVGHVFILIQGVITLFNFITQIKSYYASGQDQYLYNGKFGFLSVITGALIMDVLSFTELISWYVTNSLGNKYNIIMRGRFLMIGALILAACMIAAYFFYTIANINEQNIKKDLEGLAYNDELTELANRAYCEQKLEMLTRNKTKCIVISLDLDGFKQVNDSIGHGAGDKMLVEFSDILKSIFGGSTLLGRMGGDEFIVVLDGENIEKCEELLWGLEKELELFNEEEHEFQLEVSGGYACSSETKDYNANNTYLLADAEMYKNKKRKKELEGQKYEN
ncbi:MAG: GGDEF domain-containing protein [Lachnospiraceae bacterium]|nr:GGDEF domain-containing protein [Lachnospiraceae bacterium]